MRDFIPEIRARVDEAIRKVHVYCFLILRLTQFDRSRLANNRERVRVESVLGMKIKLTI
jgi:hypothetical protein